MNFIYCIDDNYNIQCNVSVYSLLQNTKNKVNVYVLHKTQTDKSFFNKKVLNHKNLNNITVYKFNTEIKEFNVNYMYEATYYVYSLIITYLTILKSSFMWMLM